VIFTVNGDMAWEEVPFWVDTIVTVVDLDSEVDSEIALGAVTALPFKVAGDDWSVEFNPDLTQLIWGWARWGKGGRPSFPYVVHSSVKYTLILEIRISEGWPVTIIGLGVNHKERKPL
jgi:hypothetical protein